VRRGLEKLQWIQSYGAGTLPLVLRARNPAVKVAIGCPFPEWAPFPDLSAAYTALAASGLFDILAHPDLIKKFEFQPAGDLRRFYDPALEAIAGSGAAIEINTAGWHKPCAEQYPAVQFLSLAREAGIPLVLSSDAHAPAELGRDFGRAVALAREAGYEETALFAQRQRGSEPLP